MRFAECHDVNLTATNCPLIVSCFLATGMVAKTWNNKSISEASFAMMWRNVCLKINLLLREGFEKWIFYLYIITQPNARSRVEWYSTFCHVQKRALWCRSGTFLWVQFQKQNWRILPRAAKFHFKKITGTLKLIFNFWKICKYSYLSFSSKKNRQKENSKLIILILQVNKEKIMCLSPQSRTQSIVNSERKQFILLEN